MEKNMRTLILAALMTALTCIATMIIKFPTPTFGYIHLGDGMVLLSGILLGPLYGALAGGIGSMFSDIFSGYATWAPATLIIKALTAAIAGLIYRTMQKVSRQTKIHYGAVLLGGVIGEAIMVTGYFLYEAGLAAFAGGSFSSAALASGIASSALSIPFNIVQGVTGIVVSLALLPVLTKALAGNQ